MGFMARVPLLGGAVEPSATAGHVLRGSSTPLSQPARRPSEPRAEPAASGARPWRRPRPTEVGRPEAPGRPAHGRTPLVLRRDAVLGHDPRLVLAAGSAAFRSESRAGPSGLGAGHERAVLLSRPLGPTRRGGASPPRPAGGGRAHASPRNGGRPRPAGRPLPTRRALRRVTAGRKPPATGVRAYGLPELGSQAAGTVPRPVGVRRGGGRVGQEQAEGAAFAGAVVQFETAAVCCRDRGGDGEPES
ncbi:hypothetical protein SAMN05216251_101351 [Actinacidiphila alni]|uniref:Uncharacterized protein n=1 Tax=Actinacidiphila alni TaxID=380248 RepID=A0A1I1XFB1_9ACTN|nr:hypothetical protein SAMN05216251_101351 [Actinacidiphila alni]